MVHLKRLRPAPARFSLALRLRMANYGSYASLRKSRSTSSMRSLMSSGSNPSLISMGSAASLGGLSVASSKWDEHVKTTLRRNERIRLQSEAQKLRSAFVAQDATLTGAIPSYMMRHCLKAGGVILPEAEMRQIYGRFRTSEGHFAWLRFCESLEKNGDDTPPFHPKARPSTTTGSRPALRGSVSAKFLAQKELRSGGSTLAKGPARLRGMVSEAQFSSASDAMRSKGEIVTRAAKVQGVAEASAGGRTRRRPRRGPRAALCACARPSPDRPRLDPPPPHPHPCPGRPQWFTKMDAPEGSLPNSRPSISMRLEDG